MKVVILVEDGYEDLEVHYPRLRLSEEGIEVLIAALDERTRKGKYGYPAHVDLTFDSMSPEDFDGVVIPGGTLASDRLRTYPEVLKLVKEMMENGKVVAAICHGPWVLISAGVTKGKRMTCYAGIKDDVINSGALYSDEEVVVDGNLVTSRKPSDLPAFCREIVKLLK